MDERRRPAADAGGDPARVAADRPADPASRLSASLDSGLRAARALPARSWLLAGVVAAFLLVGLVRPPAGGSLLAASPSATPTVSASAAPSGSAGSPAPAGSAAGMFSSPGDARSDGGLDLLDVALKSVLVVALLFLTLRLLRRVQGGTNAGLGRIKVIESRPLAAKASLHLVALGDRRLLVGLTPAGLVSLTELDADQLGDAEPLAVPAGTGAAPAPVGVATFASLLPPKVQESLRNLRRGEGR